MHANILRCLPLLPNMADLHDVLPSLSHVDVKTTDNYTLRMFCIGFTKRRPNQGSMMGFETRDNLGFRSGLGEEEACGGYGVLGYSVGERKEERKRRSKEEMKRRRKEEDGAGDLCRRV
ncbi:hypothetical protein Droror1_Dr00006626 [Drosera rotundifolia]